MTCRTRVHGARRIAWLGLLLLLLLPYAPPAAAPHSAAAPMIADPYPDRDGFFGIVGHDPYYEWNTDTTNFKNDVNKALLENMMKEMASSGAKWVRIEFFAEYGDPNGPGVFNWPKYDWFITDLCQRYGMNILGVLSFGIVRDTNAAYALNKINDPADRADGSNNYIRGFADRATEIAGHYAGYVSAWEILNEPNSSAQLDYITKGQQRLIYADRTAAVMALTYPRLKTIRPDVPVVLGGTINTAGSYPDNYDIPYLRQLYNSPVTKTFGYTPAKGGAPWDVVADHPYELKAEEVAPHVRQMHDVMVAAGEGNKRIWVTEIGAQAQTPAVTDSGVIPLAADEQAQADFLTRVYADLLTMRDIVDRTFWFKYEDFVTPEQNQSARYGLVGFKRDGSTPGAPWPRKDAMRAYAALARPSALPTSPEDPNKPTASDARYFPETKHWIAGPFRLYWERNGGQDRFGLPRTSVFTTAGVVVQIFERARFEFRQENAGKPDEVELGLLGYITTRDRTFSTVSRPVLDADVTIPVPPGSPSLNPTPTPMPTATPAPTDTPKTGSPGPSNTPSPPTATPGPPPFSGMYFIETKHTLTGPFLKDWLQSGGLAVFGFPISEPMVEKNRDDGKLYTVQYFERARLEYHPEYKNNLLPVVQGLLGNDLIRDGAWWR